jgi:chaperone modulatory protein CbpM
MISFEHVLTFVAGLEQAELTQWIENRWVLPEREGDVYRFRDVDVARVRLIYEMRRDFSVNDEALPIILSLLDQVYGLRRRLRQVCSAIEAQPPELRDAIVALLNAGEGPAQR